MSEQNQYQPKNYQDPDVLARFKMFLEEQQKGASLQQEKAQQRIWHNQQTLSRSYEVVEQFRNRESAISENRVCDFNSRLSHDFIDQEIEEPGPDTAMETIEEALEIEQQCKTNIAKDEERLTVLNAISDVNSQLIKKIGEQL